MGGDEFVVVAPGLPPDAVKKKMDQLRDLARHAGKEVCGEDILSLSVGESRYPDDGQDAEELLAEADRRMYIEKQQQPSRKNRRMHQRMRCRVTIELQPQGDAAPILGSATDVSLGGCFVETSVIIPVGTKLNVIFSIDDGKLQAQGHVARIDPGAGIAIAFHEMNREQKEHMQRILEFVQNSSTAYDTSYYQKLLKR
jgi:hypothetical protein